ncbi:kinase-like domain-containing protein [Trametes polyzona]|nr:kinase-like domain-containing protein [Trametes polyzona]
MVRGFSALASSNTGTARKLGGPRRVRLEDLQESESKPNGQTGIGTVDEKENLRAARMIRPARSVVGKSLGIDRISEANEEPEVPTYGVPAHHPIRPRRSASLSDAPPPIELPQKDRPMISLRPGTSLGARRVTLEEKIRQEREIALEEGYARREAEEAAAAAAAAAAAGVFGDTTCFRRTAEAQMYTGRGYAPSPPHAQLPAHPHLRHQRRDSDTVRNGAGSPTAVEGVPVRHRRSPTAPEPPTGKHAQWTTAPEQPHPQMQVQFPPQAQAQTQPAPIQAPPQKAPAPLPGNNRPLWVNKKVYARLDMIGKGGSSRVYRVMTGANEIYALKRVTLDKCDADTITGYMNEIGLLKRLEGNARIIKLFDSEVKQGAAGTKGYLNLVMECGEIDLAKLLQEQQREPMDPVWIAYYWKQMLQAVHVIHEEKIVHSDLKPANFVLVRGQLKLIDFGIANAIANDTTNIQRDHQIGTVNYMSPEAIELPEGMRRLKVGRPSDVWSLGCILYQMVYGQPPFHALAVIQKMKAIPDENHVIEFPEYAIPVPPRPKEPDEAPISTEHLKVRVPQSIIHTMKSCLVRNPKARATIPELLQQNWLEPAEVPSSSPAPTPPPPATPSPPPRPATPPTAESLLKEDETIINPHYMMQLLTYGIRLGQEGYMVGMTEEKLMADAERLVRELKELNRASR